MVRNQAAYDFDCKRSRRREHQPSTRQPYLDQVGNVSARLVVTDHKLGPQGSELDECVVVGRVATVHDGFKGLLKQELLQKYMSEPADRSRQPSPCLLGLGEIRSHGVVEGKQLEDQGPRATVRVDAMSFILFPFGEDVSNHVLHRAVSKREVKVIRADGGQASSCKQLHPLTFSSKYLETPPQLSNSPKPLRHDVNASSFLMCSMICKHDVLDVTGMSMTRPPTQLTLTVKPCPDINASISRVDGGKSRALVCLIESKQLLATRTTSSVTYRGSEESVRLMARGGG